MLQRSCYALLVFILCVNLLACSNQNTEQPQVATPVTTYDWETRRPGAHERIEITYQLPQRAHATLILSQHQAGPKSFPTARLMLTNANCRIGHQAAVTYTDKGAYYTRYFNEELSWNGPNTIAIQWLDGGTLQVTANNETLSIPMDNLSRWLQITTQDAPIEIQQVKYVSK